MPVSDLAAHKPRRLRLGLKAPVLTWVDFPRVTCPHCGVLQATKAVEADCGPLKIQVWECASCPEPVALLWCYEKWTGQTGLKSLGVKQVHPPKGGRKTIPFPNVPGEIVKAYGEANGLLAHHFGAAGAYARRALELTLEAYGYKGKTLFDMIGAANSDEDSDRRLPRRYREKLDYIKEIGNFAIHIRRAETLEIVEISEPQVIACLEAIEAMLNYIFEEPARDRTRVAEINKQLEATGKRAIPAPTPVIQAASLEGEDPDF